MRTNRILIKETQLPVIKKFIQESNLYDRNVKVILKDLMTNYEPAVEKKEYNNEFFEELRINKKINNEIISPADLLSYFKHKYNGLGTEFLTLVISDWYFNRVTDDLKLSKNVSLNK